MLKQVGRGGLSNLLDVYFRSAVTILAEFFSLKFNETTEFSD